LHREPTIMIDSGAVPTSILAFLTTVHLGLLVLRAHRSASTRGAHFVNTISLLFSASPWMMPTPIGLGIGAAAHLAWFAACEHLLVTPPTNANVAPSRAAPAAAPGVVQMARQARDVTPASRRPKDFVPTHVVAVFAETPDIRTFRMARPEGFEFTSGQFLTVRLRADGRDHVRCYSISSPPGSRGHLEITVKRLGMVSGALHASVRPGSVLHVRPPAGAFLYPTGDDRPLVLIAGGVGITPLMSMLRHAIEEEPARRVVLFYSVRTVEDIAFRDELSMLSRRHEQFRAIIAISDGDPTADFFPGRIDASLVTAMMPDVRHAICLVCGPAPMLDAMTDMLSGIGVPKGQINFEVFQAAVAASAGPSDPAAASLPEPAAGGAPPAVSFKRSKLDATPAPGQKLLEIAEGCGADIPSLCRMGVCGTCRTKIISGNVRCASKVLDEQDRKDGYVLACVSEVMSDCVVDA
jgi:ferredoxin-NADP reductase